MFGDMMGLMGKLQEAKAKAEETKERLKTVMVQESSSDDLLKVLATANGRIKEIELSDELLQDKEQLEDYLILTLNKALEKAQNIHDTEMAAVAKEGMPNIPGMDLFK
jgi:DNA-binding protein YbaB